MNEYKDTLKLYDDLIKSGVSEPAARAQAQQLGAMGNVLDGINFTLAKIDKDMIWMRIIGGAMVACCLSSGLFGWLAK